MSRPPFKAFAALTLALGMWFVPSLSTQGAAGTGHRLAHPDEVLIAAESTDAAGIEALRTHDRAVTAALPR